VNGPLAEEVEGTNESTEEAQVLHYASVNLTQLVFTYGGAQAIKERLLQQWLDRRYPNPAPLRHAPLTIGKGNAEPGLACRGP